MATPNRTQPTKIQPSSEPHKAPHEPHAPDKTNTDKPKNSPIGTPGKTPPTRQEQPSSDLGNV